ncbi:MAG: hypothetical protein H7061_05715 [Bdellovibrionaceae bacterium]|nr:hypothetical protein [Bdellovibrio sp.]
MKTGYDQFFKNAKQTSQKKYVPVGKASAYSKKPKKKSAFPIKSLFSFLIVAGLGIVLVDNFEVIEAQIKRIEIGVGLAQAEEKAIAPPAAVATSADHSVAASPLESKSILEKPADDSDYLFKLAERKKQLDQKEEALNKLAGEIAKQKEEIEEKLKKLEETRLKISTALEEKIKLDDGKVETLVQMYTNMKPQQAAKVFENLDEDLVIEILGRMKKKSAADILNLIKPEKAQVFAERFAGYRVPASK